MKLVRCDNCWEELNLRQEDQHERVTMEDWRLVRDDSDNPCDLCPSCAADWDRKAERLRKEKANV